MRFSLYPPIRPTFEVLGQPLWPFPKTVIVAVAVVAAMILLELGVIHEALRDRVGKHGWMQGWALSHLAGFFLVALILPDFWFLIFWAGVVWEFFESGMWRIYGKDDGYWYYVAFDVVMNGFGVALGASIGFALRETGKARLRWIALILCIVAFAVPVLLINDQWRYINLTSKVGRACGCTKECDYDLEAAPEKPRGWVMSTEEMAEAQRTGEGPKV